MLISGQTNRGLVIVVFIIYNLNLYLINAGQLDNLNREIPMDANQFNFQMTNPQMATMSSANQQQQQQQQQLESISGTSGDLRVFPFVVDPLIIIAMIALPTIGLLGISSLIMPLIPVGIYLIQLFFPVGGSGKRKKRDKSFPNSTDSLEQTSYYDNEIQHFIINLSKAFDKYTY